MLARRRRDRLDVEQVARGHRELAANANGSSKLGEVRWEPGAGAPDLAKSLRATLGHPGIVDLVLFGSQARGGLTGFSDVDAILVIEDEVAEAPSALRALRPHVLAAQRAVIAYQPMQHHAFEVATPSLLSHASEALGMPAVALDETRSLYGKGVEAVLAPDSAEQGRARLADLLGSISSAPAWPHNPCRLHGLVAMWELLPALYFQALGERMPKSRSFKRGREDFGDTWWPYDVLEQVREQWVRSPHPMFVATSRALRNPWLAVAIWTRLPVAGRQPARSLLSNGCLDALRGLAREMADRAC
jgi:nucleotidyltransferase-like protein